MNPALHWCRIALAGIAAVALFAMMVITFADVIGRYLLSAPLRGAYELTEYLLALMVFTVLPQVTQRREHVTTGLFEKAFQGRLRRIKAALIDLLSAGVCAYLAYAMYGAWLASARLGEASPMLGMPKPPLLAVITAMCATAALILLWLAVQDLRASRPDEARRAAEPAR